MADRPERISIEDFTRVDMRVGRIIDVQEFPEARKPSYRLRIDFGPLGIKKSSAQIKSFYTKEELLGRFVVGVVNFAPRQVGPMMSEVLTLGAIESGGHIVLLQPDKDCDLGSRIA